MNIHFRELISINVRFYIALEKKKYFCEYSWFLGDSRVLSDKTGEVWGDRWWPVGCGDSRVVGEEGWSEYSGVGDGTWGR